MNLEELDVVFRRTEHTEPKNIIPLHLHISGMRYLRFLVRLTVLTDSNACE